MITNSNHCALPTGVACADGEVCSMCASSNNGCAAPGDVDDSCLFEASATASNSETVSAGPGSTTGTTTSTTEMTATEPTTSLSTMSSTGDPTTDATTETETETVDPSDSASETSVMCDPGTPASPMCQGLDPSKPYCVAMDECGDCTDLVGMDCSDVTNGAYPACHPELGTCVECTVDNEAACGGNQVCNQYKNDCGPCFEHEQCTSGACNLKSGTCFPDSNVFWVERRSFCNDQDGSEAKPYCHLFDAINDHFEDGDLVLMLKPGIGAQGQYQTVVTNGIKVAIIGVGDTPPKISNAATKDPLITIDSNSSLYISNVDIVDSKAASVAIQCSGSTLHLDRVRVAGNISPFNTSGCGFTLQRSVVTNNTEGSQIAGSTFRLINTFVTNNDIENFGTPFRISAMVEVIYSTIVANQGSQSTGFSCLANNNIDIRNSVLIGQPPPVAGCNQTDSGSFIGVPADLNTLFQEPQDGVYRPQTDADEIKTLAAWSDGDPYVDFDGLARPNDEGAADFAGAARP
ncbi:MAG: hypothetical protein R3A79_25810 [Nannocystaceae bacterium]